MRKPFAITLDPGSSLANHTGTWRTERPVYVDRLPPCNQACPAGENIQGWLAHAESGDYEGAWRLLMEENPLPAVMGRVCYHPCETVVQPDGLDERGRHQFDRALPRRRGAQARLGFSANRLFCSGKRVLVVGAGPSGLSAAYHLARAGHEVTICEAGPARGRHDALRHPEIPPARGVLDAEIQRILDLGVELRLNTQDHRYPGRDESRGFDAAFLAVGAHIGKRAYIPAGARRGSWTRCRCCARWRARTNPSLAGACGVRRRQHRARRGAHRQAPRRRGSDHRLPAHAREDAGARLRARGSAAGRRAGRSGSRPSSRRASPRSRSRR